MKRERKGTKDDLIKYCRDNGRVCPMPTRWNELWERLPNRKRVGAGWEPGLPLILAAWHDTPAILKMVRLQEHIEWAEKNGALDEIGAFLRSLPEEDWAHIQHVQENRDSRRDK
jgi:hypothetical protein